MPHNRILKLLAAGWLLCTSILILLLIWLLPQSQINSSVMALLPKENIVGIPNDLIEAFNKRLDKQLIWLISPDVKSSDEQPAKWWQGQLQNMPELTAVTGPVDEKKQKEWAEFVYQYRYALLDKETQSRLMQGADIQAQWVLSQLYSPFAGVSAKELIHDPLLLTRSAQMNQTKSNAALQLTNGWITSVDEQGRTWFLIRAELKESSYNISSARTTVAKIAELNAQLQQKWPDSEMLQRGTLFYSDYASQQAEKDISTIGVISGIGIILLILVVFRSLMPLVLTLVSLAVGVLCGINATLLVFGEIHIMTLVMSTSVVGISIDYALHYLTERMIHGEQESAFDSLKKLLPALFLAVVTSSAAYLVLLFAPFPGLQQLAIFAAFGLTGAFLTVCCLYPLLSDNLPTRANVQFGMIDKWLDLWRNQRVFRWVVPAAIFFASLISLIGLTVDDDISKLQALPAHLQQQEQKIAKLTGQGNDQKWLIVYADSAELVLQKLEQLAPSLDTMKNKQVLADYRLLPLSSLKKQQENIQLITKTAPNIVATLQQSGIPVENVNISQPQISAKQWLDSAVSDGWRLLWVSQPDGKSAVLIPINGVTEPIQMQQLAQKHEGVHWVDKRTEFSELFSMYRAHLSWLLVVAVGVISAFFIWKMGVKQGINCIVPMLVSLLASLAVLALSGQSLNLFSLLALVLVLGIGIDYTLFFSNPNATASTSMLSIFMAALTTQLTFGLLALSSTQAIAGFGLVLMAGIFTIFLLSPLALPTKRLSQ